MRTCSGTAPALRGGASFGGTAPALRGGAFFSLLLSLALLAGCSVVAPYERERLARRDMQLSRNADASAGEQHANAYREASSGAEGTSGGGCGCN